jgi:hypothetical protein
MPSQVNQGIIMAVVRALMAMLRCDEVEGIRFWQLIFEVSARGQDEAGTNFQINRRPYSRM